MEQFYGMTLVLHIITMSISILLSALLAVSAFFVTISKSHVYVNYAVTFIGILAGLVLLISNPTPSSCAVLFSYVLVFALVNGYVISPATRTPSYR